MEIKDLKEAEIVLINTTKLDDIKEFIDNQVETWNLEEYENYSDVAARTQELFYKLYDEIRQEDECELVIEALQWLVFDKLHDIVWPIIKMKFFTEDLFFFEKCKLLCDVKVSAEQFGADENFCIPLSAAVVELSVIDNYKSPVEKMNCLCATYDLVFAEIKTAMIVIISQDSEKDNEIPVIDNSDIIPVLMVIIFKSRLAYMLSNLFFIKSWYHKMENNHIVLDIFKAFESAVNRLIKLDLQSLKPMTERVIRSIDLKEYMRITCYPDEEKLNKKTLVNEANRRILSLITRSTSEDHLC